MDKDKPKKILVVDDEADVRDYLRLALEEDGFDVVEAVDGKDALELVHARVGEGM